MSPKEPDVVYLSVRRVIQDNMELNYPEWNEELFESGEMERFVQNRVIGASEDYARLVWVEGLDPLEACEKAIRHHVQIDPMTDSQQCLLGSENAGESKNEDDRTEIGGDKTLTTETPKNAGKVKV